jgi:dTDP-4-amino-4,6-dideoxygalactose transaminase
MNIPFLELKKITDRHSRAIHAAVARVIDSGWYLQGRENHAFEKHYADYIGTRHAIGTANGLDALTLILRAWMEMGLIRPGDEVIVPANTYIASIIAITENGLVPVPVEPRAETCQIDDRLIERAITNRTRAVMIVHLYGRCAYTYRIGEMCRDHRLKLIEDNAQAAGCLWQGRRTGSLGSAAGHSFYPGKNLGALGDAGAVTTNDDDTAEVVRSLANYGSEKKYVFRYVGRNSRLDEIQAAVLDVKLPHLDEENDRRRTIARIYLDGIRNPRVETLPVDDWSANTFHIFPVFCDRRDALQSHLAEGGVQTLIHYPIPPHLQQCYRGRQLQPLPVTEAIHRRELSLPMSPELTAVEARRVVELINSFR